MKLHRTLVGLFALLLATGLSGCLALDPGGPGGDDPPSKSPEEDEQDVRDTLGIQCEASLGLAGTFAVTVAQPADVSGCWPVGIWRFTATVEESDCDTPPALEEQYEFEVTWDEVNEVYGYTYLNDPTWERILMKVSSGGGGLCEGGFEIFSADGKTVLNLKPALQADASLNGFGEYAVYGEDQWVEP